MLAAVLAVVPAKAPQGRLDRPADLALAAPRQPQAGRCRARQPQEQLALADLADPAAVALHVQSVPSAAQLLQRAQVRARRRQRALAGPTGRRAARLRRLLRLPRRQLRGAVRW